MTDTTTPPQSTNRWYTILGFQFSRQQLMRAAKLLAAGGIAFCVAFAAWYIPPRATSRLIRSVGGSVNYRPEQIPNVFVARLFHQQVRMFGLTATDEDVEDVQLTQSEVTDAWLPHLKPLEGLKHLYIDERQLGPGLANLAELPELSGIAIWNLRTGDLSHLQRLPNLRGVSLVQADCSGLDLCELTSLSRLETLGFPATTLTARQFEQIAQITTLSTLDLSSTAIDSGQEGIVHLTKLPKLNALFIRDVTDKVAEPLSRIESLAFLSIHEGSLTDEGASLFAKLRKLQILNLVRNAHPINVEALRKQMPSCQINYSVR